MKKKRILIITVVLFVLAYSALRIIFSQFYDSTASVKLYHPYGPTPAESIIIEHFKWWNKHNLKKMNTTLSNDMHGITWNLENLLYVKLISIKEDTSSTIKNGYLYNGRGYCKNPKYVKVFRVQYEIKLIDNKKDPEPSGNYEEFYTVIKQDDNSPWLIDEMGE